MSDLFLERYRRRIGDKRRVLIMGGRRTGKQAQQIADAMGVVQEAARADERARIKAAVEAMRHAHAHEGFVRAWGFIDQVLDVCEPGGE